ncbi:MAG: hypothetical protein JNM20_06145 [Rhizobiales bacterium]|nr:hypothetical protein [Hyphomicrobiales bacterium]
MTRTPPKLALPWILEEDWPRWQAVDRGVPSYERWVELFDRNLKLAEACGWPYERVPVKADAFNEWCQANRRAPGKFDRSLYALELLRNNRGTSPLETAQGTEIQDRSVSQTAVPELPASMTEKACAAGTDAAVNPELPTRGSPSAEVAVNDTAT